MHASFWSAGWFGVEGFRVSVEVHVGSGSAQFRTVGLPDSAVREAKDRVRAAVINSDFAFPVHRVTANLAPAQRRKAGTQFDLALALSVLGASGQLEPRDWTRRWSFLGELALDGSVRPIAGALLMACALRARGARGVVLPEANLDEAAAAGLPAVGVPSLREAAALAAAEREPVGRLPSTRGERAGRAGAPEAEPAGGEQVPGEPEPDLAEVRGQALARRALEIAAAGGHNLLMIGPPGTGKSMLARRLPGLLPPLTDEEAVEVTKIYAAAGKAADGLVRRRPFRAPHSTASTAALVGGGPLGRPGELSLAHRGVLFLDELPEFPRSALESLRQPLEDRAVTVARVRETAVYPADFMLAAAMNPCPCGHLGGARRACRCPEPAIARYRARISGPLLERIDLQVEVADIDFSQWRGAGGPAPEGSAAVRARVLAARRLARERSRERGSALNAGIPAGRVRAACRLDSAGWDLVESAASRWSFSPRALDRLLRVARTIADLSGAGEIREEHVAEALHYRNLDRQPAAAVPAGAGGRNA